MCLCKSAPGSQVFFRVQVSHNLKLTKCARNDDEKPATVATICEM